MIVFFMPVKQLFQTSRLLVGFRWRTFFGTWIYMYLHILNFNFVHCDMCMYQIFLTCDRYVDIWWFVCSWESSAGQALSLCIIIISKLLYVLVYSTSWTRNLFSFLSTEIFVHSCPPTCQFCAHVLVRTNSTRPVL